MLYFLTIILIMLTGYCIWQLMRERQERLGRHRPIRRRRIR